MFVQNHHSLEELQRLTNALTKKRIWLRHQAVVLAKQGHSAPAIARALGCSHRAVQAWVGRYNQGGLAALQERPHTGRPPRLAAADVPRFRDRLEAGPTPEDGVCTFRCQDLRRILEEEFGVSLRRQAIYDLLHRLDYSSLMPRPQHEQANPEVQEFFKEIVVEQIDAIAAAHPEEEIHTYFQDEARFDQKGTITRNPGKSGVSSSFSGKSGVSSSFLPAGNPKSGVSSSFLPEKMNRHWITRGRHTQPPLPSDSRYKAWPKSANSVSLVPESGLAEAAIHVSSVLERGWPLPRGLTHSGQGDWKTLHWRPAVKRS